QLVPLPGVGGGAVVGGAARQVQLPARLLPAVETGVADEPQPLLHRHVAELPADEADLVVRALAEAVLGGLLESHGCVVLCAWFEGQPVTTLTIPAFPRTARACYSARVAGAESAKPRCLGGPRGFADSAPATRTVLP